MNNTALPLLGQYMPQLQSLSLEYVFISSDLAAFITSHSDTLESIWLNQCYSDTEWPETNTITWGAFFSSIATKDMKALSVFDVAPSDLERLYPRDEKHYRHQEAVRAQELRERFPARRMFDYKHLDDKYGMVFDSEEKAFERFENGSDHLGWGQLCRIADRNSGLEPCMCGDDAHWRYNFWLHTPNFSIKTRVSAYDALFRYVIITESLGIDRIIVPHSVLMFGASFTSLKPPG